MIFFLESGNIIESGDEVIRFIDYSSVKNMYYDSASLIKGFEDIINNGDYKDFQFEYKKLFDDNARDIENKKFVEIISYAIEKEMEGKNQILLYNGNSFKTFFGYLLKAIAEYQEKVIETNFIDITDIERVHLGRKQTFLSYAYYDKGLTQSRLKKWCKAISLLPSSLHYATSLQTLKSLSITCKRWSIVSCVHCSLLGHSSKRRECLSMKCVATNHSSF